MESFGWWSLIPTLCVLIIAFSTRRTLESLLAGAVIGFIILEKQNFFPAMVDSLLATMGDPTVGWITLIIVFFGGFIALLVKSGGALAFGNYVAARIKSKKGALLATWIMGLIIFIDDYLNALVLGTAMQRVTDKYRISREYLAYIIHSTAAPVCVIVPISTWAVFVSGIFEKNGVVAEGLGGAAYIQTIPLILYGWVAILVVVLSIFGIIPKLGQMKKAELRAETTGICIPESKKNMHDEVAATSEDTFNGDSAGISKNIEKPRMINFIIPIAVLIFYTWFSGIDLLQGIIVAVLVTIAMLFVQRLMGLRELFDTFIEGTKPMIYIVMMFVASFMLVEANDQLGVTTFVIEQVKPLMNAEFLPVVAFISLSLVAFATGAIWGIYAITLPIIIPLAQAVGADLWLSVGAVISAGAFGSHLCPYGDSTLICATASGIEPMTHTLTQMPYVILSGLITAVFYVVLGFVM
ncbi:Na+/H+ antiporter NhaC family protein [Bacillus massiliigorillae]|uniref:Na+/H+ antiporter NhaC family protein n=1 Tax=Bacillus massiliigorillae TaxID=1243664 RepID=UPI0003A0A757|nr:Na+/H+ antiporter NhaC family protein [Bacillus massiliigorillae]